MIIGICGFIGSGKDTVADYLVEQFNFNRESFAASLKDAISAIFNWDRELIEGKTADARKWRDQVDTWWAERLNIPNLTPRWVLQNLGTEVIRRNLHNDIWIASVENRLKNTTKHVVVTDCRFPNEIAALKKQNALIIRVKRGSDPSWYNTAEKANTGDKLAKAELCKLQIHESETAWAGTNFDVVVENNTSLDELYTQIRNLVEDRLASK